MKANSWVTVVAVALACILSVASVQQVNAQSKVGTTSAQFLGIGVGPKAMSMGGAYVSFDQDVSSIYWNPGAIAMVGKTEAAFSYTNWLVGTKFEWFGGMLTLDNSSTLGLSFTNLNYGSEEVTTVESPDGTGAQWSAADMAIALTYSRMLTDRFSIGGSVKYINQSIWNESASTFGLDLGLIFITGFHGMRIGMSISNFGGDMQLSGKDLLQRVDIDPTNSGGNKTLVGNLKTDSWPIPLFFRVGLGLDVVQSDLVDVTLATDAVRPSDNTQFVCLGTQIGVEKIFFIRGGYKLYIKGEGVPNIDQQEGLSLGVGVRLAVPGAGTVEANYASTNFGVFGNINTLSLGFGF